MFDFDFKQVTSFLGGALPAPGGQDQKKAPPPPKPQAAPALQPDGANHDAALGAAFAGYADDASSSSLGAQHGVGATPADANVGGDKKSDQFKVATDKKEKAAQLKQAQDQRAALEENLKSVPGLSDVEKQRILDRAKTLTGDDLIKEQHALDHAMRRGEDGKLDPNATAALGAYADCVGMINSSNLRQNDSIQQWDNRRRRAPTRLDSDMLATIVNGVSDHKEEEHTLQDGEFNQRDATDTRGNLSRRGARDAARSMLDMSNEEFEKLKQGMDKVKHGADGAEVDQDDATARQAVLLQAVAARRDHFDYQDDENRPRLSDNAKANTEELTAFADKLQGMSKEEIVKATTAQGVKQAYANTCATTTAQVQHAAADPIYAMKLQDPEFAAEEQKRMHRESAYGADVRTFEGEKKREELNRLRLNSLKSKDINQEENRALKGLYEGNVHPGSDEWDDAQDALETMREKNDGHPTDGEIWQIQHDNNRVAVIADHSLRENMDATHMKYERKGEDGRYGEKAATDEEGKKAQGERLDEALLDGQTVPITVRNNYGGHAMSVSNVRGEAGNKQYFVHDPMSGKQLWVSEQDFQSGAFADRFGIQHADDDPLKLANLTIGKDDKGVYAI